MHEQIQDDLRSFSNPRVAQDLAWFFKTGPGEYGEGDKFLGLKVPQTRMVAAEYKFADWPTVLELAKSEYHEDRLCAVVILTNQFEKAKTRQERTDLFEKYLSLYDLGAINNWDLVDVSANRFGKQLIDDPGALKFLAELTKSQNLWKQRSAVIFTFPSIAQFDFQPTLLVCELLIDHKHDLIHKAVGWALREVGKKDLRPLKEFLATHSPTMPRTALRYAIEKLPEAERQFWLSQKALKQLERGH